MYYFMILSLEVLLPDNQCFGGGGQLLFVSWFENAEILDIWNIKIQSKGSFPFPNPIPKKTNTIFPVDEKVNPISQVTPTLLEFI